MGQEARAELPDHQRGKVEPASSWQLGFLCRVAFLESEGKPPASARRGSCGSPPTEVQSRPVVSGLSGHIDASPEVLAIVCEAP